MSTPRISQGQSQGYLGQFSASADESSSSKQDLVLDLFPRGYSSFDYWRSG